MPSDLLATMVTTTTYGTWLPGDLRGYVEDGDLLPANPKLHRHAENLLQGSPVYLSAEEQQRAFEALQDATLEFGYDLHAVSIESWHAHLLLSHGADDIAAVVGRIKTRMRQAINRGRVWTAGYDKRYCFTHDDVEARRSYIQRHPGSRL